METKVCTKCKETKSTSEFYHRDRNKNGLIPQCKDCRRKWNREYYYANHERLLDRNHAYHEANRFKVALLQAKNSAKRNEHAACSATIEELELMFSGHCAICGVAEGECSRRLCMDHCHVTGKFRGWICLRCNSALSLAGDLPELLDCMASHLRERP